MHDPKAYLANLFGQECAKFQYSHEDQLDDYIYRVPIDFQESLGNIIDRYVKDHVFKYRKDLKESTLHFRKVKLAIEENLHRQNIEKESQDQVEISSAALVSQSNDSGKVVMETPMRTQPSQMLETLHKEIELKRNIENLSFQLKTQTEQAEPQPKKKRTRLVIQQVQVPEAPAAQPQHIPQ